MNEIEALKRSARRPTRCGGLAQERSQLDLFTSDLPEIFGYLQKPLPTSLDYCRRSTQRLLRAGM
jgi:hypothetical protein